MQQKFTQKTPSNAHEHTVFWVGKALEENVKHNWDAYTVSNIDAANSSEFVMNIKFNSSSKLLLLSNSWKASSSLAFSLSLYFTCCSNLCACFLLYNRYCWGASPFSYLSWCLTMLWIELVTYRHWVKFEWRLSGWVNNTSAWIDQSF